MEIENKVSQEESEEYVGKVVSRIKNLLTIKNISQKDFANSCDLSPSALSKLLKGKSVLSLKLSYKICEVLQIQPEELLSYRDNTLDNLDALQRSIRDETKRINYQDSLLFDTARPAFKGIVNDPTNERDYYYFYTKPTISSQKTGFLKGKLQFIPSNTMPAYCSATLTIETGKIDRNQQKIEKTYNGQMVISLPMGCCYVLVSSPKTAEINLISFSHMFLNEEKLVCRLAACLTTSAGANRRPVLEKAIISRRKLEDEDLERLEGQLFMNTSQIAIRSDVLEDDPELEKQVLNLLGIKEENKKSCTIPYYELDEILIRSSSELTEDEKTILTNKLRKLSGNPRYVKVSGRADELVFSYIDKLEPADSEVIL